MMMIIDVNGQSIYDEDDDDEKPSGGLMASFI